MFKQPCKVYPRPSVMGKEHACKHIALVKPVLEHPSTPASGWHVACSLGVSTPHSPVTIRRHELVLHTTTMPGPQTVVV